MPRARGRFREIPDLTDPRAVIDWIRAEGGLKRTADISGEFKVMPGWMSRVLFRTEGRSLDELAQVVADAGVMSARDAHKAILHALGHYGRAKEQWRARATSLPDHRPDVKRLVASIRDAAQRCPLPRASEWTDREVLKVHLKTAEKRGRVLGRFVVYKLSVRSVARAVGVGIGTVVRAHRRLTKAGLLARSYGIVKTKNPGDPKWQRGPLLLSLFAKPSRRTVTWALSIPARETLLEHTLSHEVCSVYVAPGHRRRREWVLVDQDNPETGHPVLRGPTVPQRVVLGRLSGKPRRAAEIARELSRTRRTVERHLVALEIAKLAIRSPKGWRRA